MDIQAKENTELGDELEKTKKALSHQTDELGTIYNQLDDLKQYSHKNSIKLHRIPEKAYKPTEEAI